MAISSLEAQEVDYVPLSRGESAKYLGPLANSLRKVRKIFLSQTLTVEEKKLPLVVLFVA